MPKVLLERIIDFLKKKMYNQNMTNQTLTPIKYAQKLEKIEKEILKIKKGGILILDKIPISLRGILRGIKISEKEIASAKRSLFKKAAI